MIIRSSQGLSAEILENGSVKCFDAGKIRIGIQPASLYSPPGVNLYLRKKTDNVTYAALLGPASNSHFKVGGNAFIACGKWGGLSYRCVLRLSEKNMGWLWNLEIKNNAAETADYDVVYLQDVGLKAATNDLINEYYASQYIERLILDDALYGSVICCRQNMKEAGRNPWLMIASMNGAESASTDGVQFYGPSYREGKVPAALLSERLPGECAGESSRVALQESAFRLAPGDSHHSAFVALFLPDHPEATSTDDLNRLPELISCLEQNDLSMDTEGMTAPVRNIFNTSMLLPAYDLDEGDLEAFFGKERRHVETAAGRLLSFFYGEGRHVVLKAKELITDRPHGHIMQAMTGDVTSENIMSTTAFAFGVFNSHLTQGNTNFNSLLAVCANAFNLFRESGQRIFVEAGNHWYLLGLPSAFEMGLNDCRWIYKYHDHCFQIRSWASPSAPRINTEFRVIGGGSVRILISHQLDPLNGWTIGTLPGDKTFLARPAADSMIARHYPDPRFRIESFGEGTFTAGGSELLSDGPGHSGDPFFVLDIRDTKFFGLSFIGEVSQGITMEITGDAQKWFYDDCREAWQRWQGLSLHLSLHGGNEDIEAIREIMPWYGMNAMTHYLTPHGLEQFGGAAWGTRDIAQGPFELLLCLEKYDAAKQVLRTLFSHQDADGGWPQWWMFDAYSSIRADNAHGDIYYWCILALSNYIKVTGDIGFLDESLPYYHEQGLAFAEMTRLSEHMDRLIDRITRFFFPGTSLVPYGGGDWNDSLQPVSKVLAQRMISSWTVEMNYQAFDQYRQVYLKAGRKDKADALESIISRIKADFNKYLVKNGIVAGYGLMEEDGSFSVLLHPVDLVTNIYYSILPMDRGILSGLFDREQAERHQQLTERHLKGPDGARLMDWPLRYKGGLQTIFQRAESSTFFGREIGLMYTHEHLRYAESLAVTGKAEAFMRALRQAMPVAYRDIVPCGDYRQSNCYYSSSDVAFRNRYEAYNRYDDVINGKLPLKGGWRIYSSGPGIFISLVITQLLGLRKGEGTLILDPVMPASLDGLTARIMLMGYPLKITYHVKENDHSPVSIMINGNPIPFTYEDNPYRRGGAVIPVKTFLSLLQGGENTVEIKL